MKKKTYLTAAVATVLIAIAVAVNWKFSLLGKLISPSQSVSATDAPSVSVSADIKDTYFDNARYSRAQSRSEAIAILNSIVNDETVDEATRQNALDEVTCYAKITESEASLESVLKAKGFDDCIVFLTKDTATVVVGKKELSAEESAQIFDVILSRTGLPGGSVTVVPYNE